MYYALFVPLDFGRTMPHHTARLLSRGNPMTTLDLNSGALAPVTHETLEETLQCIGTIPEELNGTLIRNGPNPFTGQFSGNNVLDWWPEAAMLHGLRPHTPKWTRHRLQQSLGSNAWVGGVLKRDKS